MSVALDCVVWLGGWPEIDAPNGVTPPLLRPFGPVPRAGEPGCKLNQVRRICACAQFVNTVSETCGVCVSIGLVIELPLPGPLQGRGRMLLFSVTVV